MFLGVDSGPMHLAAAVGTPVISVFSGQSKPGIWFPFQNEDSVIFHETSCCGCRLEVCGRENKRCILSITPDEVLRAVVSIQERLNGVLRATGRDGHSEAVLSAK
jgi:ADP-heptose:LPS heptosyltransferase